MPKHSPDAIWNRRAFLRATAAGAALGLPAMARLSAAPASSNEKIRLGLIGLGWRGGQHLDALLKRDDCEVVALCDPESTFLDTARRKAPKATFSADLRTLLDQADVDAVVISTCNHWHCLAAVWACQAGKDVYVEKNPANSIWEGRKMIEAARKYGRIVQVGFQNRSGPYAASARDYIAAGKLGRIVHVKVYNLLDGSKWEAKPDRQPPEGLDWDAWLGPAPEVAYNPGRHMDWHPWWDYKGGTLADDAIHQLDLTRMVLGNPAHPKSVLCIGGNYAFQSRREVPEFQCITYDYGDFAMTCESGNATGYMRKFPGEVRYGDKWPHWPTSATRVEIYGTKALMYLGRHGCGWQVVVEGGKILDQDKGYFPDKWHQPNFIDCMRSRKQPNADIGDAHRSACLVHMANTSYRVGQRHLYFDGQAERYTNSDDANALLKPAFRKHYRIPETV